MALTALQRDLCRLIAANRVERGESYVAGGVALNTAMQAARVSRDIDLFHDTFEALHFTWEADRALIAGAGYAIEVERERRSFVQAVVRRGAEAVVVQWVHDSAYRFFPLVTHPDLGLTLHPFDLATNKVLALVGRLEVRDWVDTINACRCIQPLGYLSFAACGKDPGFSPLAILDQTARSCRYSRVEVQQLVFEGAPPDAAELSTTWRSFLAEAREVIEVLPAEEAGCCVITPAGELFRGDVEALRRDLDRRAVGFHEGSVGGALPTIVPTET